MLRSADCHIQDRILPLNEGDLAIVGSTLYHRIECRSSPVKIAALFFQPDLIRCDGGSDSAEYLSPFLPSGSGSFLTLCRPRPGCRSGCSR